MSDCEYLDVEDLLRLVRALEVGPVRDLGLLEAAAARPQASAFGVVAYDSVALKAAALMHSIVGNRALADGNKRLALLATAVFVDLNGYSPDLSDDDAFALVMDAAAGAVDVEEIAMRLRPSVARSS